MMQFVILGGLAGWALSLFTVTGKRHPGTVINVLTGVGGALVAGWLLMPLFHVSPTNENANATTASLVSLLGAVVPLTILSVARWAAAR